MSVFTSRWGGCFVFPACVPKAATDLVQVHTEEAERAAPGGTEATAASRIVCSGVIVRERADGSQTARMKHQERLTD